MISKEMDVKEKLSLLWIFAMFNYIYADILSLYEPGVLEKLLTGSIDGVPFTHELLFGAALLMETAIAMVLLSRILEYRWNRIANILARALHTLSVFSSMFVGSGPSLFYIFFGSIEIITTLVIVWLAWTWRKPEE